MRTLASAIIASMLSHLSLLAQDVQWQSVEDYAELTAAMTEYKAKFVFRNTSNEAVFLTNVVGSCHCSSRIEWSKGAIAPGQTGFVDIVVDLKDKQGLWSQMCVAKVSGGHGELEQTLDVRLLIPTVITLGETMFLWKVGDCGTRQTGISADPRFEVRIDGAESRKAGFVLALHPTNEPSRQSLEISPGDKDVTSRFYVEALDHGTLVKRFAVFVQKQSIVGKK
jgi:hypothetical protein